MKRITLVLLAAVVCLGVSVVSRSADDPLVGKWKLNVEKSKATPADFLPKAQTRTVEADGDGMKYTFDTTKADGSTANYYFTVKFDGQDYPVSGSGAPFGADHVAIKKASDHAYNSTLKKDGKAVATTRVVIAADGKSATLTQKGKDDKGKPVNATMIYDKE